MSCFVFQKKVGAQAYARDGMWQQKKKQRQPAKQTKRIKVSAQKLCAGTVLSGSAPGGGRA
jgi:hypothetical protein